MTALERARAAAFPAGEYVGQESFIRAGEVRTLAEGRALVRRSVEPKVFEPKNPGAWDDAYARFRKILS